MHTIQRKREREKVSERARETRQDHWRLIAPKPTIFCHYRAATSTTTQFSSVQLLSVALRLPRLPTACFYRDSVGFVDRKEGRCKESRGQNFLDGQYSLVSCYSLDGSKRRCRPVSNSFHRYFTSQPVKDTDRRGFDL